MTNHSSHGSPEILRDVIRMNPSMEATAQCVALFEADFQYPIESAEGLVEVFKALSRGGPFLCIGSCRISEKQVRRDVPKTAYPIQSRAQLIGSLLVAFEVNQMIQRGFVRIGDSEQHQVGGGDR